MMITNTIMNPTIFTAARRMVPVTRAKSFARDMYMMSLNQQRNVFTAFAYRAWT